MPNTGDYVRATDFDELKPKLSIGTVTTGAAGTNASASITGATPNFKLNLTIPRGNTGATGATGPAGPSGTFTGPLKPTNNYWCHPVRLTNGAYMRVQVPSGGTWAVVNLERGSLIVGTQNSKSCGVLAGGTYLVPTWSSGSSDIDTRNWLCWRIQ